MSEAKEPTEAQITELGALLEANRAELERSLAESAGNSKPVDLGLSIGRLTRVDALQQQHMAMARRQRLELKLQQTRSALARIASAVYGDCVRCEEPIGFARLRAGPEAPLCRSCQSEG